MSANESFTFYIVYKKTVNRRISAIRGTNSSRVDLREAYVQTFMDGDSSFIAHADNTDLKIITVVIDRTAETYEVYKNGTSIGSNSNVFNDGEDPEWSEIYGGGPLGDINFGNALIYKDAHSSTDVGTVSDWLNTKYKIY